MSETEIALLVDRLMRRTHAGLNAKSKTFDTEKVGPGGGMILLSIADLEPAPIHDLVEELARDKSQITRAVQSLERKGLIARETASDDARVSILKLTPKGRAFVQRLRSVLAETIGELLGDLSRSDRKALKDLLSRAMGARKAAKDCAVNRR